MIHKIIYIYVYWFFNQKFLSGLIKVLHNSWESQSNDYAVIPEIRINEIKKEAENHCQTSSTKDYDVSETRWIKDEGTSC